MKSKIGMGGEIARALVWVIVFLWCMMPPVWLLIMVISNAGQANPQPGFRPQPMPNQGLMVNLMSSAFMLGSFLYGMWCAVGVVMGMGLDRVTVVIEALANRHAR